MSHPSHRSSSGSSRVSQTTRSTGPAFPSCPLSARPAKVDQPGSSPSWEELLGQR
ncbi:MAG: hypothetical protein ACKOBY_05095 [Cyanobium sp.]